MVAYLNKVTGTNTVSLTGITIQAGDKFVLFAFRDGNATPPTVPPGQGWQTKFTFNASNPSYVLVEKDAAGPSEGIGTFTNATSIVLHIYRPSTGETLVLGTPVGGAANGTTVNYPALTLERSDSWVLAFAGHVSTNTTLENPPAGMVNRANVADATDEATGHDTNGPVSSWTSKNVSVAGSSGNWRSVVVEMKVISTATSFLLDLVGNAYRAASLRKLRQTYAGASLRVRRANGEELDIGFDASGWVDTQALMNFVGIGPGLVVKFYDQTGNARDWTAIPGVEPRIVNAGVLETLTTPKGAVPAIYADTPNSGFTSPGSIGEPFTFMGVWAAETPSAARALLCGGQGGVSYESANSGSGRQAIGRFFVAAGPEANTALTANTLLAGGVRHTGSAYAFWKDGVTDGSGSATETYPGVGTQYLLTDDGNGWGMVGWCCEMVEWASALSDANALATTQNQNAAFRVSASTATPFSRGYIII